MLSLEPPCALCSVPFLKEANVTLRMAFSLYCLAAFFPNGEGLWEKK